LSEVGKGFGSPATFSSGRLRHARDVQVAHELVARSGTLAGAEDVETMGESEAAAGFKDASDSLSVLRSPVVAEAGNGYLRAVGSSPA
jgi:hypothetical protein